MKVVLSHPTGNANVRAVARGFSASGILAEFNTSIATFPGGFLDTLSSFSPLTELRRRSFDPELKRLTHMYPFRELGRLAATKAGMKQLIKHETGPFSVDAVYRALDFHVGKRLKKSKAKEITAVYAYEDGAHYTFLRAKERNLICFYDLPIGYWRAAKILLKNVAKKWPEWIPTMTGLSDSLDKLAQKDEELKLADLIFVASSFTKETLQCFPDKLPPVKVIPYGFPAVCDNRVYLSFKQKRPLKLLFVGGLSQRKGIANLFDAVKVFGSHVELTVVGNKTVNECLALDIALRNHKWIPSLPHADILKLMQANDVLVFPSLFEGFGLVISEAMSQGTPVITTDRTAGPDLIEDRHNGWLTEADSTEKLKAVIEEILCSSSDLSRIGRAAIETAKRRSWDVYGKELTDAIVRHVKDTR